MADVTAELECSVCLNTFTNPVNLTCGHTFCRLCIEHVLDTQETSRGYSCPECREKFVTRPTLHRNIALRKILHNVLSTDQEETRVLCTYCVDSSVPAIKSCLLCEAHLCEKHLRVHSKAPEHVLCDPTTSPERRKCSIHKKILEYYCPEDSACICLMCRIDGAHQGHHVDILDVASENRKKKLRNVLERMLTMREETEERVQSLKDHKRKSEEKADDERERVIALFRELRRRLEDLEKRVLRDISGQAERVSSPLNDLIRELEIKKDELSRRMHDIEELCNMADPLTVLQESDSSHLCNIVEGNYKQKCDKQLQGDLDFVGVSHTLHKELSTVMTEVADMMPASNASTMSSVFPLEGLIGTRDGHTGLRGVLLGEKVALSQHQFQPNCEVDAERYNKNDAEEECEDLEEEESADDAEEEEESEDAEEESEDGEEEECEDVEEEELEDAEDEESEGSGEEESEDGEEEECEDAKEEELEDTEDEESEGSGEEESEDGEEEECEDVEEEELEDTEDEESEGSGEEESEDAEEEDSSSSE